MNEGPIGTPTTISIAAAIADAAARSAVLEALTGAGRPDGVLDAHVTGETLVVRFDAARTAPRLIEHLISIECERHREPELPVDPAAALARAIADPELDRTRLIEAHL